MLGQQLLILPFGILPLVLLGAYIVWKVLEATGQRTVTNDRRSGITEFPTEISTLLNGTNNDELAFSEDGKSVILTLQDVGRNLSDKQSAMQYLNDHLRRHDDDLVWEWAEQLAVVDVSAGEQPSSYKLTITMPSSTVLSMEYIENEIKNIGRVFIRNTVNETRYLLSARDARHVEKIAGRLLVRIGRVQLVPTFLGNWKDGVMSERQITRNIKNRLWNQVDVRCISIDRQTYCGEIVFLVSASVGRGDRGLETRPHPVPLDPK